MHRATLSLSSPSFFQSNLQNPTFMPPQAVATAQTLATFTLSSAASAKTSLCLGSAVSTFAASVSERTSVNNPPFFYQAHPA